MYYRPFYVDAGIRAYQNNSRNEHIENYYKNFVDTVIPRTPELAYYYGFSQYYGALDSRIDEYLSIMLNSYAVPLAAPFANMQIDPAEIPEPFKSNPAMIAMVKGTLKTTTMMGYYSEWSGYGSTRLAQAEKRTLEYKPISWEQIDYPGPSLGYRALRIYEF